MPIDDTETRMRLSPFRMTCLNSPSSYARICRSPVLKILALRSKLKGACGTITIDSATTVLMPKTEWTVRLFMVDRPLVGHHHSVISS